MNETSGIEATGLKDNGNSTSSGVENDSPEQEPTHDKWTIGTVIRTYLDHVDSLASSLEASMFMANATVRSAEDEFRAFAKEHSSTFEEDDDGFRASFASPYQAQAERLSRVVKRARIGLELVPRSYVVALVSEFDAFLGSLVKRVFLSDPRLINDSERTFTVSDLLGFESVDAAKDYILAKEVEALLRKSHDEQFSWLEARFGLPLRKEFPSYKTFIELAERRNLFVHSDGMVSEQYLAACSAVGVSPEPSAVVGTRLNVSPEYYRGAHACVSEVIVKLGQVLWRKLFPIESDEADRELIYVTYNLIFERKFDLAAELLGFACETIKRHSSDASRRVLIINRAQAHKWLGDESRCNEILDKEDWSACGDKYTLAIHVLRDEFDLACELMRRIGANGDIGTTEYENWPLFRRFRESDIFQATYSQVFGTPFAHLEKQLRVERIERLKSLTERIRQSSSDAPETDTSPFAARSDDESALEPN